MTFGQKLKTLRLNAGLTQAQLASKLSLSKANISKYESDTIQPNFETLGVISSLFGVSVDYLLGKEEKPVNEGDELNVYLEELKNRPEMRMLFSLAKGATKEDVERAVAIIEALRKNET
jgi:transcriptional regulator with XRE-family HTH domain